MSTLKSPDGLTSLELVKTDYLDENGSKSYGFTCKVKSHGFAAELENIWFYKEDIMQFVDQLNQLLASQKIEEVELRAMSDFTCSIKPSDSLGHFTLKTNLESPVYQNSASIVTEAETQTLTNLAEELKEIVHNA